MAIQDLTKTCDRQNRRHPDLVSRKAGELIRLRAVERDIQAELEPWQRRHTEPPAEPPRRVGRQQRERGMYTRQLLNRPHDHWPVRPTDPPPPPLRKEWGVEWLPMLIYDEHPIWPMRPQS